MTINRLILITDDQVAVIIDFNWLSIPVDQLTDILTTNFDVLYCILSSCISKKIYNGKITLIMLTYVGCFPVVSLVFFLIASSEKFTVELIEIKLVDEHTQLEYSFFFSSRWSHFWRNQSVFLMSGAPLQGMPGSKVGPVPIVQMYGVTMEGNSVLCHIHGFVPYFYVPAPPEFQQSHCSAFQDGLNKAVLNDMRSNKDNITQVNEFCKNFLLTHYTWVITRKYSYCFP